MGLHFVARRGNRRAVRAIIPGAGLAWIADTPAGVRRRPLAHDAACQPFSPTPPAPAHEAEAGGGF